MGEYKFQSIKVYQLGLDYVDMIYNLKNNFPRNERYNLSSQLIRSATSIEINITEGSTGQSDKEQFRFLRIALRSYIETVAGIDLIQRREYLSENDLIEVRKIGKILFYWILNLQQTLNS